ncbi:MAG: hypothetical protein JOZ59_00920 [Candidatus Eremiobacteraeota bacterium]|nr:hypothetical protein [Candidatus Eremiobacteraeota bacterium]
MNVGALCDGATAARLRVDWLLAELEPISEYGRERFRDQQPFASGEQSAAQEHAERIAAIAKRDVERLDAVREALRELPEIRPAVSRARLGATLVDADFWTLLRFCETAQQLASAVDSTIVREPIVPGTRLLEALSTGKSDGFAFYLSDRFSETLAKKRHELQRAESRLEASRAKLAHEVAAALDRPEIATDQFIVMRDELRGEVPRGVHVIREAATYLLCELELDEVALDALQERDRCATAVATAEQDVRKDLSALVSEFGDALDQIAAQAGNIDVLVAAARYTQRYDCVVPAFEADTTLRFTDARFLPLQHELALKDRRYVPITAALERANAFTGPNMGGKTAVLSTAGFLAFGAAFGLPVPAKDASLALFNRIQWLGVGTEAEGDDDQLLSSFAREVVRLRDMLQEPRRALWLIDEFAHTTSPDQGQALQLAVLERLRDRDDCALAATHLSIFGLRDGVAHFVVGALRNGGSPVQFGGTDEALRALAQRMDYGVRRVREAPQNTSDAIELAELLGLDKELVQSAKEMLARCNR